MQTITMTELRFKPRELLQTLYEGGSVDLIHRSRPVATISPKHNILTKRFEINKFKKLVNKLNFVPLSLEQIDKRYREAMLKKHGKYIL